MEKKWNKGKKKVGNEKFVVIRYLLLFLDLDSGYIK